MTTTFPSLRAPRERAFEAGSLSSEMWDQQYRCAGLFTRYGAVYQTYGDGTVKHAHSQPLSVQDAALVADWMGSLAAHMLATGALPEGAYLDCELHALRRERVEFLSTIGPAEKKRWLAVSENKVSAAPGKAFDKRWRELPAAGLQAPADLFSFTYPEKLPCGLTSLANYALIADVTRSSHSFGAWIEKTFGFPSEMRVGGVGEGLSYEAQQLVLDSFNFLLQTFDALTSLVHCGRLENCWRHNHAAKEAEPQLAAA